MTLGTHTPEFSTSRSRLNSAPSTAASLDIAPQLQVHKSFDYSAKHGERT
jgi:hypothetical protein